MSNTLILLISIMCTFFLTKCSMTSEMSNELFVEKYQHENFDVFLNKSFFIRDIDINKNPIVLAYDYKDSEKPCGFLSIIVDKDSNIIKSTTSILNSDNCYIEISKEIEFLAIKFVALNINRLRVDSNRNVFISILPGENVSRLIYFSDLKYKTEEYRKWRLISGNWYEQKKTR